MKFHLLLKELECSLLRLVASLVKGLNSPQTDCVLLLADDTTLLGLHQILARQTSGGVSRIPVPDLGL